MSDRKTRLLQDKDELNLKVEKLENFTQSVEFSSIPYREQRLLSNQLGHMVAYHRILEKRISYLRELENE